MHYGCLEARLGLSACMDFRIVGRCCIDCTVGIGLANCRCMLRIRFIPITMHILMFFLLHAYAMTRCDLAN